MKRKILIIALAVVVLGCSAGAVYRYIFLHPIRVATGSMANTLLPGDLLIVKKRAFGEIARGDIIVFRYTDDPSMLFISRVVGMPNETIHLRDKVIMINNQPLGEKRVTVATNDMLETDVLEEQSTEGAGSYSVFYLPRDENTPSISQFGDYAINEPYQIPLNHYFVLGDNRDNSADSRFRGTVPREMIFGKPTTIYWSSRPDDSYVRWERIFSRVN